ncbi:hypothetical protein A0H81_14747 [Grifola frondosa]|uniref:Uncharacterized protein n=1 Tax=Grifola frondosa TaxID=5627 RepID=A0A1C7LKH1_GRIFR|nr:hypothetical protein A0H81_14747 [Grifola frondosa]
MVLKTYHGTWFCNETGICSGISASSAWYGSELLRPLVPEISFGALFLGTGCCNLPLHKAYTEGEESKSPCIPKYPGHQREGDTRSFVTWYIN